MDIFKNKRIHPQECTKHIINPQQYNSQQDKRGRKGQPFAPFLFAYTSEREKETTTPTEGKPRTEAKQGSRTRAGRKEKKRGQEEKRRKRRANTPQAPKPPNSTRAQKPHKPRKTPNPYKHTSAPQNPLKPP